MTQHTFHVLIDQIDAGEPVLAAEFTFRGRDYDGFDADAARHELVSDGRLALTETYVACGGHIVPSAKLSSVRVELAAKSVNAD